GPVGGVLFALAVGGRRALGAVLGVPAGDELEVAVALAVAAAGLAGLLRVGREVHGGRVVARLGRPVRIGRVGEAGTRVGVDVPLFDPPRLVDVLLVEQVHDLKVCGAAVEAAGAAWGPPQGL